ncbi:hypothetical protein BGZ46_001067, partial [Entomortierella lignicola]
LDVDWKSAFSTTYNIRKVKTKYNNFVKTSVGKKSSKDSQKGLGDSSTSASSTRPKTTGSKPATDTTNPAANTSKKQAENIKDELHCEHEIEQVFHQEHFIVVDLDSRHPQYSYCDHAEDRNTKRCHEYFDISGIDNVYYSETQE